MASMSVDEKLAACGAVMFDCEIVSAIPMKTEKRDPSLYYCGGWDDFEGMGISVISAYDFVDRMMKIYMTDNLKELQTLFNSRKIIIGFNNDRFDNNLVKAHGIEVDPSKSYDMWKALANTQPDGKRSGFSLASVLKVNNLPPKGGLGSDAPMLAQTGKWGKLISYCLGDTQLQVYVLKLMCNDLLVNPNGGGYMIVKKPWESVKVDDGGIF